MLSGTDNDLGGAVSTEHDRLRALMAELIGNRDILRAVVDRARAHSPAVAALPREETVRHTLALLRSAITAFTEGRGLSRADLAAAARLGADRAEQGVPLAALLDGFQAARAEAVRQAIARVRESDVPPDVLLDAFVELDALITGLEHQLTHAHHATESERVRTTRDQRAQLLRRLLLGSGGDSRALEPVGLDETGRYHCLASAEHDPRAAHRLETRLTANAGGVYGLLNGYLVGVAPRPPSASSVRGTLLVTGPAADLADLPEIYRMCCAARDSGQRAGLTGLVGLDDLAVDSAMDAMPALGEVLITGRLAKLRPGIGFHRELVATAVAYLDHGGRLEPTAGALHVHPNTVKYRLRRLRELTGFSLDAGAEQAGGAVRHAVHWWWALRGWQRDGPG